MSQSIAPKTGPLERAEGTGPLRPTLVAGPGPHPTLHGWGRAWKRAFDLVVAGGLLVALAPLMLVVALLVKATSPGPVIFRQARVGLGGRPFVMCKFRTMTVDAEARRSELELANEMAFPLFKMKADPRLTAIGAWLRRTSIDELPQLWQVVRGEMSLVGPRPPLTSEVTHFTPDQMRKFDVMPGITGLWQVSGRHGLVTLDQMIALDLAYIRSWSPGLDLRIALKTIGVVLRRGGA